MVEIKQLQLATTLPLLKDLFEGHWEEVYGVESTHAVDIDIDFYAKLESMDMAFGLFAFYDKCIVGYSVNFVTPNIHSKGRLVCNNDALYVDPLFRDTPLGIRLIKRTEELAKKHKVDLMAWNSPINSNLGKILPRFGYKPQEVLFMKEV